MARRGPDAVDKLVGRNIRVLRLAKGLSQTELADALGVTLIALNNRRRYGEFFFLGDCLYLLPAV
jgi:hypothetical protein